MLARRKEEDALGRHVCLDEGPNDVELFGQFALRTQPDSIESTRARARGREAARSYRQYVLDQLGGSRKLGHLVY